jgi:hypothetical protein
MRFALPLGFGVAAVVAAGALHASPSVPPPGASLAARPAPTGPSVVTGRGTTVLDRFDFEARARHPAAASVLGRAVFESRGVRSGRHWVQITCLRIAANRAVLGGRSSRTGGGSLGALFYVEDKGRGDGVDRISRLVPLVKPPKECPQPRPLTHSGLRVRQGDIVVRGG